MRHRFANRFATMRHAGITVRRAGGHVRQSSAHLIGRSSARGCDREQRASSARPRIDTRQNEHARVGFEYRCVLRRDSMSGHQRHVRRFGLRQRPRFFALMPRRLR